jgi:DNA-binding transcriptional MocR family regulator
MFVLISIFAALAFLQPLGCNLVGIRNDGDGLIPEHLESTLKQFKAAGKRAPKVLYTIPNGQNPAGSNK